MLTSSENRILSLAIRVSEQLKRTGRICDHCDEQGSYYCCEGNCDNGELSNVLRDVLEEMCVANPFILNYNKELKMHEYWIESCKNTIQRRKEYKEEHPND